jgi:DNA polymerase III subunit gamma/tau
MHMAGRIKNEKSSDKAGNKTYTVLARRYRSRDFDELIGQEPIARTLQNAIKSNRTAHAYLFCGTRGVGKTSMARIFAKALNATDDLKEKQQVGDAILRGDDLDVIEIDAASNRGIDNARELIANAGLHPARSPFKIYIIDEVHMLTREAFNALLKTMEEPPEHVKFILCTTEAHKVPATIQSRCQRFDFRPISSSKIAEQIKMILKEENVKADDEVISQVARLGNGSMRDSLSLLDRLLAGGDAKLTADLLEQMLGLPDQQLVTRLVDAIGESDAAKALQRGAELMDTGISVEQALEMLTDHLRNLMVVAACGDEVEMLDLSDENLELAKRQAAYFDAPALVHMIAVCDAVARSARASAVARALFDAALVRLARSENFADIAGLLQGQASGSASSRPSSSPAVADSKKKALRQDAEPELKSAPTAPPHPPHIEVLEVASQAATKTSQTDADLWPQVLEVAARSVPDRQRTEHLVFQSFDGRTLRLSLDEGGADVVRYLTNNIDKIVDLVKRATGRVVRVELDTSRFDTRSKAAEVPADNAQGARLPLVQKAIELFDAELISVQQAPASARSPSKPA